MSTSSETYPLDGVTVIDFSRLLPGPWCTQMLGDLGAVVIKVEEPKLGDASRYNPPLYQQSSVYYNSVNGNKKSITLDLRTKAGQCIAHRLMESADVVVESFRPGVSKKLGVDYSTARALNRGIIYCSFSGFGQSGPWVNVSGHDLAVQSMSGLMTLTAEGNEVPHMPGFQAADYAAATMASIGVLSAVIRHMKTGNGAYLDIAMFDSLFSMSNVILSGAKARTAGGEGYPMMQLWGGNPRYSTYATADNKAVSVALLEAPLWERFCQIAGCEELINPDEMPDARHSTHGDRACDYKKAITDYCAARSQSEVLEELEKHGLPVVPVLSPDEALHSENVAARELVATQKHPVEGDIPVLVNPLFRAGLSKKSRTPAPSLGEDTANVLHALGFTDSEIQALKQDGALG